MRRAAIAPFRLVVDGTLCDGHGICALACPERIGLDCWGYAVVDRSRVEDARTAARARRAVAACPARALSCLEVALVSEGRQNAPLDAGARGLAHGPS